MARKKDGGPTWEQLTEEQQIRVDALFRLILKVKARTQAQEARP